MLEEFKVLDAALIMHAMDMTTVTCEAFNREALEIEFLGKAANAGNAIDSSKGSTPWKGHALLARGQFLPPSPEKRRPRLRDHHRGGVSPT